MKTAVIIGVGAENGLGSALCKRFAKLDLHVVAAGRTQTKLDAVVATIESNGGKASSQVTDCTVEDQVINLFEAASKIGTIDIAIYNAGNIFPGNVVDMEADYFRDAWEVCCFGGLLFGREAIRHMQPKSRGTIIFTGASASLRGSAGFSAFNVSKAGLRALAQSMSKESGSKGIHVAHVVIDGTINGGQIRSKSTDHADNLDEEGLISLEGIADAYEYLYKQQKTAWSFEVDLRTAIEKW